MSKQFYFEVGDKLHRADWKPTLGYYLEYIFDRDQWHCQGRMHDDCVAVAKSELEINHGKAYEKYFGNGTPKEQQERRIALIDRIENKAVAAAFAEEQGGDK